MKLAEALNISNKPGSPEAESFGILLAWGFEPLHLATFLKAHLRLHFPKRSIKIHTGLYGDLAGNMERAIQGKYDAAAIVMEWEDLDPRLGLRSSGSRTPKSLPDILTHARIRAELLLDLLQKITKAVPSILCLPMLPLPPVSFQPEVQAGSFEWNMREIIISLAAKASGIPNLRLLNPQRIDKLSPMNDRHDIKSELMSGFPYHLPHASVIAEQVAWLIHYPVPKKGLVTDLDDTLLRGILGEDGVQGVSWDLDRKSHIHALYQQMLDNFAQMPELVEEIFKSRGLFLKKDRIFPIEVNWGPKSESIGRILAAWNIGPESVVFVDDSAMELDQVKSVYSEIECLQFPTLDEKKAWDLLYQLRDLFGKETIQEEDALRLDSLRSAAFHHGREQSAAGQPEDFLREVQAELTVCFASDSNDSRAFELVNKTNQFNLNGRRYTLGEWKAAMEEKDRFLMTVSYIDRYGPLGKIAVIKGRRESGKAFVDEWVMSCRAFGRRIEHKCLDLLFQKTGADEIAFDFLPTPRNEPAREFFESLLGEKPHERFLLSRKAFSEKCPPLYQTIKEIEHGEFA